MWFSFERQQGHRNVREVSVPCEGDPGVGSPDGTHPTD